LNQINVGKQKQDETIKDLQKQLKDVKRDFAEYREEKENEGSVAELMDNIELLTVGTVFSKGLCVLSAKRKPFFQTRR